MFKVETVEQLQSYLAMDLSRYDSAIDHPGIRISHVCIGVAKAIRMGDAQAVRIGMAILLRDPSLPFGRIIKSKFARSLRHHGALLSNTERERFLIKTADLLTMEYCPRELTDYCKLVKHLGEKECAEVASRARPTAGKSLALVAGLRPAAPSPR